MQRNGASAIEHSETHTEGFQMTDYRAYMLVYRTYLKVGYTKKDARENTRNAIRRARYIVAKNAAS